MEALSEECFFPTLYKTDKMTRIKTATRTRRATTLGAETMVAETSDLEGTLDLRRMYGVPDHERERASRARRLAEIRLPFREYLEHRDQLRPGHIVHIAPSGIKSLKQASPYKPDQPREADGNTVSIHCSSATSRALLILFPVPVPTT